MKNENENEAGRLREIIERQRRVIKAMRTENANLRAEVASHEREDQLQYGDAVLSEARDTAEARAASAARYGNRVEDMYQRIELLEDAIRRTGDNTSDALSIWVDWYSTMTEVRADVQTMLDRLPPEAGRDAPRSGRPPALGDNSSAEVFRRHEAGESISSIARLIGVSRATVRSALQRGQSSRDHGFVTAEARRIWHEAGESISTAKHMRDSMLQADREVTEAERELGRIRRDMP